MKSTKDGTRARAQLYETPLEVLCNRFLGTNVSQRAFVERSGNEQKLFPVSFSRAATTLQQTVQFV